MTTPEQPSAPTPAIDPPTSRDTPALQRGTEVGRYVVLDLLGHGGMGQVYSAYDPELDRKVALKLIRPRGTGEARQRLEARLRREAQALAKLNHQNVVTVFDIERVGERVVVAMEYVEGQDLSAWLRDEKRDRDAILTVFLEAGEGLATAHDAGVVHRDFKPRNVLLGRDGRVRVCDFGLAQSVATETTINVDQLADVDTHRLRNLARNAALTATGDTLGTPGYIAPEQRSGGPVGPAADQYSFCVSLFRALHDHWPDELEPTKDRLDTVLRRGLATAPDERYGSMRELLDALRPPARKRLLIGALMLLVLLVAALWTYRASITDLCIGGAAQIETVWNEGRRASVLAQWGGHHPELTRTVLDTLDARRDSWVDSYTAICQTSHRGEQSEALLDRRMACLDERRVELRHVIERLTAGATLDTTLAAMATLPAMDRCDDRVALLAPVAPPDPDTAQTVSSLRRELATTRVERLTGSYDLAITDTLVSRARDLGYWPLTAEGLLEQGRIQELAAEDAEQTVATYETALLAAQAGGHDRVAVEAFLRLVRLAGYEQVELERAEELATMAQALLSTLGERRRLGATLDNHLGLLRYQQGNYEAARDHLHSALDRLPLDANSPLADRLLRAVTQLRLGNTYRELGDLEHAEAAFEASLEGYRNIYGPAHPELAQALDRLGGIALLRGDDARAEDMRRTAVDLLGASLGDNHPRTLTLLNNLGAVALKRQRWQAALDVFQHLDTAFRDTDQTAKRIGVSGNLGTALLGLGRGDQAITAYETALRLQTELYGETHPATGLTRYNLGEALNELGRHETALTAHRRTVTDWRGTVGDDHVLIAHGLNGIGWSLLGLKRHREAITTIEDALERWEIHDSDPVYKAEAHWYLAQAYAALDERSQALENADQAYEVFSEIPERSDQAAEIDLWRGAL
ncbi:MAG: serine/threonine-protein kinase [Acidobacteriota bacterium]